jgi:hypothetical protein
VGLLRKTMGVYGMAPERPADWVDPYAIKEKVQERVTRLADSAMKLARHQQDKAMSLVMQAHVLKTNAKKAKRKMPDWVDHQFPLMNVVEPKDGDIKFLPREEALKLGERGRAAKRQRLGPPPQQTQPRQVRERPAETATSGALEAEEVEIIRRTVYFVADPQTTLESDMTGPGTFRLWAPSQSGRTGVCWAACREIKTYWEVGHGSAWRPGVGEGKAWDVPSWATPKSGRTGAC